MKIKALKLFTNNLALQTKFYQETLGFELVDKTKTRASFKVGHSLLHFQASEKDYKYHYCFLIPCNKMEEAKVWLESRTEILKTSPESYIKYSTSWNAQLLYFYDGTGNVAEFIARHDLKNEIVEPFDNSKVISINEIGISTKDIQATNAHLESVLKTRFWKGNFESFGTNGNQHGLFILVNSLLKKHWYPTKVKTQTSPFEAIIEAGENIFNVNFKLGNLSINSKKIMLN